MHKIYFRSDDKFFFEYKDEQIRLNKLKLLLPEAFKIERLPPANLMLPDELKYDYMIHCMSSKLGHQAEKCSEYDYWLNFAFERLDNLTHQYFIEQTKNE